MRLFDDMSTRRVRGKSEAWFTWLNRIPMARWRRRRTRGHLLRTKMFSRSAMPKLHLNNEAATETKLDAAYGFWTDGAG